MERFENAQIGDLVYCRSHGLGQIKQNDSDLDLPIKASFEDSEETYTYCGRINRVDVEPLLFYRKGEERYLTERPEPEIDWATVEPGTPFEVSDRPMDENTLYAWANFAGMLNGKPVFYILQGMFHYREWNHIRRVK